MLAIKSLAPPFLLSGNTVLSIKLLIIMVIISFRMINNSIKYISIERVKYLRAQCVV